MTFYSIKLWPNKIARDIGEAICISPMCSATDLDTRHSMSCISSLARREYAMRFLNQLLQISLMQIIVKVHLHF